MDLRNPFNRSFAQPITVSDRFTVVVDILRRSVAALAGGGIHPQRMDHALIALILKSLCTVRARFLAVAARLEAGTLRKPPARAPAAAKSPFEPKAKPPALHFPNRLRSNSGWLCHLVNAGAIGTQPIGGTFLNAVNGSDLARLMLDPKMQDMLARAPQLRRILSPLCTMLGVQLPPLLNPTEPDPTQKPKRRRAPVIWPFVQHAPPAPAAEAPTASAPPLRKTTLTLVPSTHVQNVSTSQQNTRP